MTLKPIRKPGPIASHLLKKQVNILVTNVCNLACGGCSQQCGQIAKPDLWHIPLDELDEVVEHMLGVRPGLELLGIFGGEPTLHPEFDEMCRRLLRYGRRVRFMVYTNGRLGDSPRARSRGNLEFRVDFKGSSPKHYEPRVFAPNLVAPIDVMGVEDREWYVRRAVGQCHMWLECACIIYRKKAYFCEAPAAFDVLAGEDHGWPLRPGVDPFLRTDSEVVAQAKHFCYRCGWCLGQDGQQAANVPHQMIAAPALVTKTNLDLGLKKTLTVLETDGRACVSCSLNRKCPAKTAE